MIISLVQINPQYGDVDCRPHSHIIHLIYSSQGAGSYKNTDHNKYQNKVHACD